MSSALTGTPITVLIVEDNLSDVELIKSELRRGGYQANCIVATSSSEFRNQLDEAIDVILCDYSLPQFNAPAALEILQHTGLNIPFIVISGTIGEETAVDIIKKGAADYLIKDRLSRLCVAVEQSLTLYSARLRQQQAEDLLKTMMKAVEQSADSIFITNRSGIIEYFNPAFLQTTGYSFHEVIGKNPSLLKSGKHPPEFYADVWRTLLTGKMIRGEFINRKKDGTFYTEDQTISPIVDEQGEITNFVSTGRDVTMRRQMEDALRQSEERYRALVEKARDAIFTLSVDGRFLSLNNAFEKITGWKPDDWIGRNFLDIVHPDDRHRAVDHLERGIQGINVPIREYRIKTSRDDYCTVEILAAYQKKDEVLETIIGIARDVTDRKRLEEQVRQGQKMESIGTLAGGIAHDFNNILGIILGYLEMIQRKQTPPEKVIAAIDTMKKAVDRGRFLVRQILTFARRNDISPIDISANEEIHQLVMMLSETIPKTIELRTSLSKEIPIIRLDPTQFHQALLNLCVNARDTIMERMAREEMTGVISLETGTVDGSLLRQKFPDAGDRQYVFIRIQDTGMGMSGEIRDRIFDPFFTTKEVGQGTGLGLAVVYGVVQQHHGFIDVESTPLVGTAFTLYFPEERQSGEQPNVEHKGEPAVIHGTETILLIEDEESLSQLVTLFLEQHGYTVLCAHNGIQGVSMFFNHKDEISLVLTDFGLPMMDGAEVLKKILEINPHVKVLMTSGYLETTKREEILALGIKEIIPKPYTIESLFVSIRALLDEP